MKLNEVNCNLQIFPAKDLKSLAKYFNKQKNELNAKKEERWTAAELHLNYHFKYKSPLSDSYGNAKVGVGREMLEVFMDVELINQCTLGDTEG